MERATLTDGGPAATSMLARAGPCKATMAPGQGANQVTEQGTVALAVAGSARRGDAPIGLPWQGGSVNMPAGPSLQAASHGISTAAEGGHSSVPH